MRKTDDVKRELKWKSDAAAAAAAAASSSPGSSDVTDHQQSVVRSCFSRLRRGSDFKKTLTTSTRLPRATAAAAAAKSSALEEEQEEEQEQVRRRVTVNKTVAMATVAEGCSAPNDVMPMTSLKTGAPSDPESHYMETDRRRQRVLAMLHTAEGQQMVRQMFAVRDELKQELAGLGQRLKRIDSHIEAMMLRADSCT